MSSQKITVGFILFPFSFQTTEPPSAEQYWLRSKVKCTLWIAATHKQLTCSLLWPLFSYSYPHLREKSRLAESCWWSLYPCIWVKYNSWLKQVLPVCMTLSIPRHSVKKRYRLIIITISYSCMFGNWNSAASCKFPVIMATRMSTLAIHEETETQCIMRRYSAILMKHFSKINVSLLANI